MPMTAADNPTTVPSEWMPPQFNMAPQQMIQQPQIPQNNQHGLIGPLLQMLTGNSPKQLMGKQNEYQNALMQKAHELNLAQQKAIEELQKDYADHAAFLHQHPELAQTMNTPEGKALGQKIMLQDLNNSLQNLSLTHAAHTTPSYISSLNKGEQAKAESPMTQSRIALSQKAGPGEVTTTPTDLSFGGGATTRGATTGVSPLGIMLPNANPGGTSFPIPPQIRGQIQSPGGVSPYGAPPQQPHNNPAPVSTTGQSNSQPWQWPGLIPGAQNIGNSISEGAQNALPWMSGQLSNFLFGQQQ